MPTKFTDAFFESLNDKQNPKKNKGNQNDTKSRPIPKSQNKLSEIEKRRIQEEIKHRENDRNLLVLAMVVACFGMVFYFIVENIDHVVVKKKPQKTYKKPDILHSFEAERLDLNYYITDGDYWVTEKHWRNAAYQYRLAFKLEPQRFDIIYRLAYATAHLCMENEKNCTEAQQMVNHLVNHSEFTEQDMISQQLTAENYKEIFKNFNPEDHWSHLKHKRRNKRRKKNS